MHHLGVELNSVKFAFFVGVSGNRARFGGGDHLKTVG